MAPREGLPVGQPTSQAGVVGKGFLWLWLASFGPWGHPAYVFVDSPYVHLDGCSVTVYP